MVHFSDIEAIAAEFGLTLMGCAEIGAIREEAPRIAAWQEEGFAGSMEYMKREPALFVSPERIMPEVQSVISVALQYEQKPHPLLPPGYGRVARYAWGRDYHSILKMRIVAFAEKLSQYGLAKSYTDAVPLLERAFAAKAGLGFIGKNSLLIRPNVGSYFFLGEVLASFEVHGIPPRKIFKGCGSCTRCQSNCPTGAIVSEAVVDARRCISYLTIEKRGSFEGEEPAMLGEWIFGCDICQDVCPFNYRAQKDPKPPIESAFTADNGVGPLLSLVEVLSIKTDLQFQQRFARTPLLRAKRAGLIRNACAVAVNTGFIGAVVHIRELLDDTDEVIRASAEWAMRALT